LEALTREALDGNREAWSALIALHERRVELSLIAQAVPPAQAREFAHDAWLRLMQQAAQGRLTYLQLPGLAIRQALFLARAARRRRDAAVTEEAAAEEAAGGLAEEDVESPEAQFSARERLMRARARVDSLAPSARTVFLLLYAEPQLSHAELAARVGLSVQRVRQIICEVRKELRADLEESDARPRHP
jgi:RNA polymerase sigma-70 factor (ECF subfamily)